MGGAKQRRGAERRARGCVVAATRAAYIHTYFRVGPSWLVPVGASLGRLFDSAPHCEYWETPPPSNHFRGSTQLVNPGYVLTRRRGGCRHARHTHTDKWDGLHTRHLLESTHTNTHRHKQTHNVARQSTVGTHAASFLSPTTTTIQRNEQVLHSSKILAAHETSKFCEPR